MKILIVDDIEENLYLLETILKGSGYEVVSAKDGLEALDKLKEEPIGLIISDILMPQMDGFRLCRECKKDDSLKKIPFIFYTATYTDKKDEEFALSLGAVKFMVKPQEPEVLLKILNEVIEEHNKGVHIAPKEFVKEEEIYLTEHNKQLIQKLDKKMLDLEKANKVLWRSKNRFKELFNHMSSGVIIYEAKDDGKDFIIKDVNQAVEKIEKLKKGDIIGKSVLEVFPGLKDFGLFKIFQEVYETGKSQQHPISFYQDQRITGWRENYVYKLPSGEIVSVYDDITDRKKAEETLRESERKFRSIFDNATDGILLADLEEHKFYSANNTIFQMLGYKQEEIVNLYIPDIHPREYLTYIMEQFEKQARKEITLAKDIPMKRKDGSLFYADVNSSPITFGDKTYLMGILRDITERKKAEQELKVSEERYRTVFENTGTSTVILEENMNISLANSEFIRLSGYSKEEIENKMKWTAFVVPEDLERMNKYHLARRKTGEKPPIEYEFCLKDKKGNIKNIFLKIGIIPGTKKSVVSLTDITQHKQAEERIKHLNLVLRSIRSINQLIFEENDQERLIKGACNRLTETRGYHHSWIVLLDQEGKIDTHAEAGLGEDFLQMLKLLKKGKLTTFGRLALEQKNVVIIKDPASACPDCPLVRTDANKGSVMTIRLEREGRIYGVMSVSIPADFVTDKEEQALFMEAAGDIALGLHGIEMRKKMNEQTHDLQQNYQRTKKAMDATIKTMSKIVEAKDPYTAGHQIRVSQLAASIAKELNLLKIKLKG